MAHRTLAEELTAAAVDLVKAGRRLYSIAEKVRLLETWGIAPGVRGTSLEKAVNPLYIQDETQAPYIAGPEAEENGG